MSGFINKGILRKYVLLFIFLSILNGVAIYYFWQQNLEIPLLWVLYGLEGILFVFIIMIWLGISRPMKKILKQMKYLLTGKEYKKIYTSRIDELGFMAQFFNEVTNNIESISHKLEEAQRMSSELEIASEIQQNILPKESPKIKGLDISVKSRQAVEVGGDSYDIIKSKNNHYIYLGDVTGHGAPAALVMMMVNTLIRSFSMVYDSLYEIVTKTNHQLKPRIKSTMFMTMIMLKWDEEKEKMSYIGAGHENIYVYRAKRGEIEELMPKGIALGMVDDNTKIVKENEMKFEKDDVLLIFTDGIVEAKNDANEMYDHKRLKKAFEKFATEYGPEGVLHHIALDFSSFVGESKQEDDISLIAIKRK